MRNAGGGSRNSLKAARSILAQRPRIPKARDVPLTEARLPKLAELASKPAWLLAAVYGIRVS